MERFSLPVQGVDSLDSLCRMANDVAVKHCLGNPFTICYSDDSRFSLLVNYQNCISSVTARFFRREKEFFSEEEIQKGLEDFGGKTSLALELFKEKNQSLAIRIYNERSPQGVQIQGRGFWTPEILDLTKCLRVKTTSSHDEQFSLFSTQRFRRLRDEGASLCLNYCRAGNYQYRLTSVDKETSAVVAEDGKFQHFFLSVETPTSKSLKLLWKYVQPIVSFEKQWYVSAK